MKNLLPRGVDKIEMGFTVLTGRRRPFVNLHRHNELEVGILLKGAQTAMFGHRHVLIPPNRLHVFWANTPHGPIRVDPGNTAVSIFIPLPWFLGWNLPKRLVEAILRGEVIMNRPQSKPCSDILLMRHWAELIRKGGEENRRMVLLELESRLRRLARDLSPKLYSHDKGSVVGQAHWSKYEQLVSLLARRYLEPLSVPDVARSVGLHPVYATRLFRKMSGTTIQQCIIQHRVSHAQRLIATTDKKILTIALESGFNCATQFYSAFRRIVGQTPRKYRRSLHG